MKAGFPFLKEVFNSINTLPEVCSVELRNLAIEHEYAKFDYFAEAGEQVYSIGFVTEGLFRAFYRSSGGDEYNKTFFMPGSFIAPLTALVRGKQNQINLQALIPSRLLIFPYDQFTRLYDRYPELERLVRIVIQQEWAKKEEREIALVTQTARSRYETFLADHPGLEEEIPQYHIASYLGVTPIHLSRIRAEMAGR
ncbi:Crp/Fnr family transcriptional regulator [bacterium]|nr:Crp/Fnr family transcriptional regulator [bacterium]